MNNGTNIFITIANAWFVSLALFAVGVATLLYFSKGSKVKRVTRS